MKLIFLLLVLSLSFSVLAGNKCLKDKNPCDPDLLCSFKAQWHSKAFLYVTTTMNDPARKGKKSTDGYYYDGGLYDASMAQATKENPGATTEKIKQAAGQIFEEKLKKFAQSTFTMPSCELNGRYDTTRSPPEGYGGMSTDESCKISVTYYDQQYDPGTFGQNGATCEEFYETDFAHEQIHKRACEKFKKNPNTRFNIDVLIKEEATAYKHSMKLSEARYRYLLSQCSDKYPNQENTRKEFKRMNALLKGYEARGAKSVVVSPEKFTAGSFEEIFSDKCVKASVPSECQPYAAVLKNNLMSVLALVEDSSHPEVIALFKEVSGMKDERLKAYSLGYLAKHTSNQDTGLLQSALDALLSEDYWLGRVAAKILKNSEQPEHQELGTGFLAFQGDDEFDTKDGYSQILSNEFYQSITNFFSTAHLPSEVRFIGLDSPLVKPQYNNAVLGGKGYLVNMKLADAAKEIQRLTGLKPARGLNEIQARMQVLTAEMVEISQRMQRGDFSQAARMQVIQVEMTDLSRFQGFWITEIPAYAQMKNVMAFFKENGSKVEGAIVLKEWTSYKGTSILYLGKW